MSVEWRGGAAMERSFALFFGILRTAICPDWSLGICGELRLQILRCRVRGAAEKKS